MSCTCHVIRENSSGMSYSLHTLGVLCGYCEAVIEAEIAREEWEALTPAEQIAHRWNHARRYRLPARRPGSPVDPDAPPF